MNKYTSYSNELMDTIQRLLKLPYRSLHELELFQKLERFIPQAVKFKLPDNGMLFDDTGFDSITTLETYLDSQRLNLPFPTITIEYPYFATKDMVKKCVVIAHETEDKIEFYSCFCDIDKQKDWDFTPELHVVLDRDSYEVGVYSSKSRQDMSETEIRLSELYSTFGLRAITQLLCALACKNTIIADDTTKPSPVKQSMRKGKGKAPFYSFKVLTINTSKGKPNTDTEPTGPGNHSKKRSHLRRGHIRQYKTGLKIWVNASFIGGASTGLVEKNYNITS